MKHLKWLILSCLLLSFAVSRGQEPAAPTGVSGVVVDGDTGEALPFVQIYFLRSTDNQGVIPSSIGTTTDINGQFSLSNTEDLNTLNFQMLGYKTQMLTVRKGQDKKGIKVKLMPDVYGLQDIVVYPKTRKRDYSRKNNPAVELVKNVIVHNCEIGNCS